MDGDIRSRRFSFESAHEIRRRLVDNRTDVFDHGGPRLAAAQAENRRRRPNEEIWTTGLGSKDSVQQQTTYA
jgi:hypothetical protein